MLGMARGDSTAPETPFVEGQVLGGSGQVPPVALQRLRQLESAWTKGVTEDTEQGTQFHIQYTTKPWSDSLVLPLPSLWLCFPCIPHVSEG